MSAPTRDEVIRMAREAGTPDPMVFLAAYERLVAAAYARGVAAEREACGRAKAGKPRELNPVGTGSLLGEQQFCFDKGWREGAASVRAAIRARGEK